MVVGVVVWELHSGREHLCSFEQNTRMMLVALLVWLVFFVSIFSRALICECHRSYCDGGRKCFRAHGECLGSRSR